MKNIIKKSATLFLIVLFFTLSACVPPWAKEIAQMQTTWESDTPSIQFTVSDLNAGGFGSVTNAANENVDIYFTWSPSTVKFLVYLVVDNETDLEKIVTQDNTVLYGKYAYHNKKNKQVKLTILNDEHADKLFNGLYDSIILTAMQ